MEYESEKITNNYISKVEEHWLTMFNPILNYLGNTKGKKILDIGCGNGELAKELSKKSKSVLGIDSSKKWISYCKENHEKKNLKFENMKAENLWKLKSNSFDIIIINLVLLNIYEKKKIISILKEVGRILKNSGDFIFSDLHPICIMTKTEGNRKIIHPKDFSYFKNGSKYSAIVKLPNREKIEFQNKHWKLEFYTNLLSSNKIYIKKIIESEYPKKTPKKFFKYSFPEYIIFFCKKITQN